MIRHQQHAVGGRDPGGDDGQDQAGVVGGHGEELEDDEEETPNI